MAEALVGVECPVAVLALYQARTVAIQTTTDMTREKKKKTLRVTNMRKRKNEPKAIRCS